MAAAVTAAVAQPAPPPLPAPLPGGAAAATDVAVFSSTTVAPATTSPPPTAFRCRWRHQRVPQSWKQGIVRLIYKKDPREDPANWRPICPQQVIYKTYTGLLDRRKELHVVWYNLKNAFGSVPQELLWEVLERMGEPPVFVQVCKGLYKDTAFMVGNAADRQTDPVTQLVGVFQGCPLRSHAE
ncbi:hypothetical protein PC112_g11887 [Phytophthora cactorum]|uniref:Reverse transcriptase domain-containing protein n=1 Tax=Phytophthora cactorum TaxID=29920 RepID=A0A8T1BLG5_9STRA|nr:hypothetical protein PC112_g11887 [Phytophthora cactorum]KAG2902895.1 hypothetical protein PC117_g21377 [Phytophthora cactorum]KAG4047571.1 hypothetical protein PC123_g17077 [Phytophthora cactorum]